VSMRVYTHIHTCMHTYMEMRGDVEKTEDVEQQEEDDTGSVISGVYVCMNACIHTYI
jgi:hypothetical protein